MDAAEARDDAEAESVPVAVICNVALDVAGASDVAEAGSMLVAASYDVALNVAVARIGHEVTEAAKPGLENYT